MRRAQLRRTVIGLILLTLSSGLAWAAGSSASSSSSSTTAPARDPKAMSRDAYNRGIGYRDKAWKLEEKLAEASEKERAKIRKKMDKEFRKAIRAFESAVRYDPLFFQAHGSLGYALRRVGDYQASLEAYDRSLEIEPRYGQAIEYRAEAYLGLGRIDEAKDAYMQLFRGDRELASQLLTAMRSWVEERRADPQGVDAERLEAFASWVEERAELAEQASLTPYDGAGDTWTRSDR